MKCYGRALEMDPDCADAHVGLCRCHLRMKKPASAAEAVLAALGLRFHDPRAHYFFALALSRMGKVKEAVDAARLCLAQNPFFPAAHELLAALYGKRLNDKETARRHGLRAVEVRDAIARARGDPLSFAADAAIRRDEHETAHNEPA